MSNSDGMESCSFRVTIEKDIAVLQSLDTSFMHFQAQEFNRIFDLLRQRGFAGLL